MRRLMTTTMTFALPVGSSGSAMAQEAGPSSDGTVEEPMEALPIPEEGAVIVRIGETTWEVATSGLPQKQCAPDFSGFFVVIMFGQDAEGGDLVFAVQAPHSGEGAVVKAGDPEISGEKWIADPSIYGRAPDLPEGIGATTTIDGTVITGTGLFFEDRSLQESLVSDATYELGLVEGSFAAHCPTA